MDPHGSPQLFLKRGPVILYRFGSWNGVAWTGFPHLKPDRYSTRNFVSNEKEVFFTYYARNSSDLLRVTLSPSGVVQRLKWMDETHTWVGSSAKMDNECSNYSICGAYASCNTNNLPMCTCFKGFVPKSQQQWSIFNWSAGCIRKTPLDCQHGDGFVKYEAVKLPDTSHSSTVKYISLVQCKKLCINNCSCTAYATLDIREGGSGCLLWFTDLFDIANVMGGQDLYVRVAASEADIEPNPRNGTQVDPAYEKNTGNKKQLLIVKLTISLTVVTTLSFVILCVRGKLRRKGEDLLLFDLGMSPKADSAELTEENQLGKNFGMARIFGGNESQANTNRIVGTYGYMSPEYAIEGIFSIKSDVFSFGVLLLEIVSGKKNTGFYQTASLNLLGYAWAMWTSDKGLELKDPVLEVVASSNHIIELILASDTITPTRFIRDGETLVSSPEIFELGFFSPGNSTKRYLGIWYKKSPETVVWVANRNNPIIDRQGVLTIINNGNLVLLNKTKSIIWSSNTSRTVENPVAQLLDSGNLVLKDNFSTGNTNDYAKSLS
ncbi:hypothetical protein LWI29_036840 [Acer saccharum]|uniref:Uncharacterized protein n=1 Tax=Acer saccharum TaxID=4024 RepID=A0AA39T341_ACESA|nr:hypothetical protein LWI29_036840 [Acer saccharum]